MEIPFGQYKIRSWTQDDRSAVAKYANNHKVWLNLRDVFPYPYSIEDADHYLQEVAGQNPETHFAIATDDEAIGAIGLIPQDDVSKKSMELGYWLAEPFWGRGIVTQAVRVMIDFAFSNFDIIRIFAEVFEWNAASKRVLEKAGFECEGCLRKSVFKDGQIIDKFIYAVVKD